MIDNQQSALKYIGLSEGGYVNHPKDPGGATNMGVTQRTYDAWRKNRSLPPQDVRKISKRESEKIFIQQYFVPIWFNKLPSGLDYCVADYAVNSGPGRAVKDLQRTLNGLGAKVSVDGVMGNQTLSALTGRNVEPIIVSLCERRMSFLKRLKTWPTFGKGWTRRIMGDEWGAQNWDSGVIDRSLQMAREEMVATDPSPAPGKGHGDIGTSGGIKTGLGVGAGGVVSALGATVADLGGEAQTIAVIALCIAGLGLLWVLRNQIVEWGEG